VIGLAFPLGIAPMSVSPAYPSDVFGLSQSASDHSFNYVARAGKSHFGGQCSDSGVAASGLEIEVQAKPTENEPRALLEPPVQHHRFEPVIPVADIPRTHGAPPSATMSSAARSKSNEMEDRRLNKNLRRGCDSNKFVMH
jgi:hypothetical protein